MADEASRKDGIEDRYGIKSHRHKVLREEYRQAGDAVREFVAKRKKQQSAPHREGQGSE